MSRTSSKSRVASCKLQDNQTRFDDSCPIEKREATEGCSNIHSHISYACLIQGIYHVLNSLLFETTNIAMPPLIMPRGIVWSLSLRKMN